MKWIEALKIYNQGQDKWCIPRKGSPEYERVQAIRTGKTEEMKKSVEPLNVVIEQEEKWEKGIENFIENTVNLNTGKLSINYDANYMITWFAILHLLEKYDTECAVFLGKRVTRTSAYYDFVTGFSTGKSGIVNLNTENLNTIMYQIGKRIHDCIKKGAKIVMIPFGSPSHANMMIYRTKQNSIEHFEPHGSILFAGWPLDTDNEYVIKGRKEMNKALQLFQSFIPRWEQAGLLPAGVRFIPSDEICPVVIQRGFQSLEGDQAAQLKLHVRDIGEGKCQMWSLFYLEMVLKYPDIEGAKLFQVALEQLKKLGADGFVRHIVNYTKEINKVLTEAFTGVVDIMDNQPIWKEATMEAFTKVKDTFNDKAYRYIMSHGQEVVESAEALYQNLDKERGELEKERDMLTARIDSKAKGKVRESKKRLEEVVLRLDEILDFQSVLLNDKLLRERGLVKVVRSRGSGFTGDASPRKNSPTYQMRWVDALKIFNQEQGKWCIPRRGSPDYDKVRAIQQQGGKNDAPVSNLAVEKERSTLLAEKEQMENRIRLKVKGEVRKAKQRLAEIEKELAALPKREEVKVFLPVEQPKQSLEEQREQEKLKGGVPPYSPLAKNLIKVFDLEMLVRSYSHTIEEILREIEANPNNQRLQQELQELITSYNRWRNDYLQARRGLRDEFE